MNHNFIAGPAHGGPVKVVMTAALTGHATGRNAGQRGDVDLDLLSVPNPLNGEDYDFDVEGDTQPSMLQWLEPEPEPEQMQALLIDPDRESRFTCAPSCPWLACSWLTRPKTAPKHFIC